MRTPGIALASWIAAILSVIPAASMAEMTKDKCVDANASAQDLRRDGKLAAAREQLRQCAVPACPAIVRDDCTRRLDDLESVQPSLVFDAKDAAGADLIDVRVTVDSQLLVDHLDGKPLKIDPGAHVFTFEVAGRPVVTKRLLIKEGEAGRHEHVVIGDAPAVAAAFTQPASPSAGLGVRRVVGISLAGAGLVGLGVGTVFGLMANSAWGNAKQVCGGDVRQCVDVQAGNTQHDKAVTDGTISSVGFIAGGVLVAAGAVMFFVGVRGESSPPKGVVLAPSVGPRQAGVALSGVF